MKKSVILVLSVILLTNFISAASFGIGDLGNIRNTFDLETMFYLVIFLIAFVFFYYSLISVFKTLFKKDNPSKTAPAVLALALALFTVYGFFFFDFQIGNYITNFDMFEGIWGILIPLAILLITILVLWKLKLKTLLALGALFILLGVTKMVYEYEMFLWAGIGLVILYIILALIFKKKEVDPYTGNVKPPKTPPKTDPNWEKQFRKQQKIAEQQRAEAERQRRKAQDEAKRSQEEIKKRQEEEQKRQQAEYNEKLALRKKWEAINDARKQGILNLQKENQKLNDELQAGYNKAADLHKQATKLNWTKTKDGREAYKAWRSQHIRNLNLQEQIKEANNRITYLDKRYKEKLEWIRRKFNS